MNKKLGWALLGYFFTDIWWKILIAVGFGAKGFLLAIISAMVSIVTVLVLRNLAYDKTDPFDGIPGFVGIMLYGVIFNVILKVT